MSDVINWKFLDNFEFKHYLVQLVFKKSTRFSWFHGPAVSALLCRATSRHPLGQNIVLNPVESGVVEYCENERYNFGVTFFGKSRDILRQMDEGLRREGKFPYPLSPFPLFDVVNISEIPYTAFDLVE